MRTPSIGGWLRRTSAVLQQRNVATGVVVAVLSSVVVVAAVQADGTKATNVQLDDGTVWVSNQGSQLVGRLNIKVDELDLAVSAGPDADVAQAGRDVVLTGPQGGVQQMDVLYGAATGSNEIEFPSYQLVDGIATVFDTTTGRLWVGSSATLVGAEYPKHADAQLDPGSKVVVTAGDGSGAHGRVYAVAGDSYFELLLDDQLKPVRPVPTATEESSPESAPPTSPSTTEQTDEPEPIAEPKLEQLSHKVGESTQVAAVGDELVFLDSDGSVFSTDGSVAKVTGENPVLQQTGPRNDFVLVATSAGLFEVRIGSSDVRELATADGSPARPVRVGPCVFGAWSGDAPTWFKACNGTVQVPVTPIPKALPNAELVYRVNQRNVAINSIGDGGVWADHDGSLAQVGNWQDAVSQDVQAEDAQAGQTTRQSEPQCIEGSNPPTANKDELGIRPRQSIIDVLYNDDDVNCEPIAIIPDSVSLADPAQGDLTVVDNGQHLLFSPSQELQSAAASSNQLVSFTYAVEDSSDHRSDPTDVTLTVRSDGNSPPQLRPKSGGTTRQMRATVEDGKMITYDVLGDWWDPDGDDLLLQSAVAEAGEVTSTADGVVTFGAYGLAAAGTVNVAVTMWDGQATATEQFEVTVKPSGSKIAPSATDDFISVVEGATGTVLPLANDSDPNQDDLSIVPQWPSDSTGYRVTTVQGNALQVTGLVAGTYALPYDASDGDDTSRATIRLVVLAPGDTNHAPVAVPDRVKLRLDRVVNVDVLANDVDIDGDVLAVTNVQAPDEAGDGRVRATIIDRRLVQVEVSPGSDGTIPTGPFFIGYTLSDGHAQERADSQDVSANKADEYRSQGVINVSIVPASVDQPPLAADDELWVRSGDVASAPVLANDVDPDGDAVTLTGVLPDQAKQLEDAGSLVAWVQGRNLFVKGGIPGSYELQYTVSANGKESSDGRVRIHVTALPSDPGNPNNAPTPQGLVLRAVRNATVRLQVPTMGVDRDGDSVSLLETFDDLQGAAQGNTVAVDPEDPTVMLFTAGSDSPAGDSFTYRLRDTYGAVGSATVTVVVLDNEAWPPQAHDDIRVAKPGRVLTVPLLANDTSPQDNPLQLAEKPFFDSKGLETDTPQHPEVVTLLDQTKPDLYGRVVVTVPADGSTLSEHYRIYDGKNFSEAYLRVTPDPNAPNLPPVAKTDPVKSSEIAGKDSVLVDVLKNDFDPDDVQPLTLELPAGENGTVVDGKVSIPLDIVSQTVLYRIKDQEGGTAIGVIRVPGKENHPPELTAIGRDATARSIAAAATEPLTILLRDIVQDPDGDQVDLTDTEVSVVGGLGTVTRLDDNSGFTYLPPESLDKPAQVVVQFEVTDRPKLTAAQRQEPLCNCLASLPITVNVTASSPPRVVSQGRVDVPQLDEEVVYDLAPLMVDDQGDPLTFRLPDTNPGGLVITQSGSKLTIVSHKDGGSKIPVGTPIIVKFTASDSNFDPVENSLLVTIIPTNRGEPAAATFPEQNAERDSVFKLPNLLASAVNPFPDRPLTLTNQSVDGGASITCGPNGDCQFTSANVGTFRVNYTLKDAIDRSASGVVVVVVKGKPRAPGVPRIESVGDGVVNLSWSAADMQGGAFKTYWVTAVETGVQQPFSTTGGQFTGLTNATTYHFVVEAENEMGVGESSLQSSPAVPDKVPDPPVSPGFSDYGDGTLFLSWSPPATAGNYSAIKQYEVSIGGKTLTTTGATTLTVTGLQNGTDYSYQVRAQNAATTNGGWGEWATSVGTERPSRFPDPPPTVTALNSGDGGTPRLTVTWTAPVFDGGRPISSYTVCVAATTNCQTVSTGLQATFAASRSQSLSFSVVAVNSDKHQNKSAATTSSPTVAVGNPDAPTISSVTSGDKSLVVNASSTNGSGCSTYFLEYSLNGGASWQTSNVFSGLVNGTAYSAIIARAKLPPTCGTSGSVYQSANSAPSSQTPYGPLVQPTMVGSRSGNVITWNWSTNRAPDDARPGWNAVLSGECAGGALPIGSLSRDFGFNSGYRSCTLTISATGVPSLSATWGDATPAPPPAISTSKGGACNAGNCVNVSGTNFRPNAPLSVYCQATGTTYVGPYSLGSTDAAGNFGVRQSVCWHASGAINNQNIRVTDGVLTAEQVSAW